MLLFIENNSLSGTEFATRCLVYVKNVLNIDVCDAEIGRGQYGKPFFKNIGVEFSCSHSHGVSAVLFSNRPCGVDIEQHRKINFQGITRRYFKDKDINNICVFFDEWCKREAYSKTLGTALAKNLGVEPEGAISVPYKKGWSLAVCGEEIDEPLIIFDLDVLKAGK